MVTLSAYIWNHLRKPLLVAWVGISLVVLVLAGLQRYLSTSSMLEQTVRISAETVQGSLSAGDWDLAILHLKVSMASSGLFEVVVTEKGGSRVAGPLGQRGPGIGVLCSGSGGAGDVIVRGCVRFVRLDDLVFVGLMLLIIAGGFTLSFWLLRNRAKDVLQLVSESLAHLERAEMPEQMQSPDGAGIKEIVAITERMAHLLAGARLMAKMKTQSELARQVSHDIRSPLTALNMVLGSIREVDEEKKALMRHAIQRINDIANSLLKAGRNAAHAGRRNDLGGDVTASTQSVLLLSGIVDGVITEKRIEYRDRIGVDIYAETTRGFSDFVTMNLMDIQRVLSNLINNAVESLSDSGQVIVKLETVDRISVLSIFDNGCGMSPATLRKLGSVEFSEGKEGSRSGTGLGVYHARKIIEAAGGRLEFESALGQGTTATIRLPRAKPPRWYLESLVIKPETFFVTVDDDSTIHDLWINRLETELDRRALGVEHLAFVSIDQFERWIRTCDLNHRHLIVLMDLEFKGSSRTGLNVISDNGLSRNSVVVTSQYLEESVQKRCEELGVRLLPKVHLGLIPIMEA